MNITIKQTQLHNTDFLRPLVKGTAVTLNTADDCMWFVAIHNKRLVGFVCAKDMGGNVWRFKSDVVATQYRGKGIYRKLWDARMSYVIEQGCDTITTFSSYDSRPMYLKEGFVEQHDDNKNMYMIKEMAGD